MFQTYTSFILCVILFSGISAENRISYYRNLLSTEQEKAFKYQLPIKNAEFEEGWKSNEILDYGTYDFIIIGAGSAGNVMARRLSEIGKFKILLLEAGGEETDFSEIPSQLLFLQFSDMNWGYFAKPQTTCCLGMKNSQCHAARGKVIGGCSAINALMYVRGNRQDYDRWAELGNVDWSYQKVLPYFKKSENAEIKDFDRGYHRKGGLLNVEYAHPPSSLYKTFLEAHEQLQIKKLDYNGAEQLGCSKTQVNTKHGRRHSTGKAFLQDVRRKSNLNVTTRALVTKIVFQDKTARGVIFVNRNRKFYAKARKEVILSAGAFNSPQLLMLSGIGPREHLEAVGIEDIIEDLPAVGQNMYDHPNVYTLTFHTNSTFNEELDTLISEYLKGKGLLANPGNTEAIGFIHTNSTPPGVPSLEYIFFPPNNTSPEISKRVFNFDDNLCKNYMDKLTPHNSIGFFLMLLHPKSKGSVTLKSNNPIDFPIIDYNYFSDPDNEDINTYIEGIEFIMKLVKQDAFQKINPTFVDLPICEQFDRFSREYWECVLRHTVSTIYHPTCTTRMGLSKRDSVVNGQLKVHGVKNLRVVDAGVAPSTISGHLNAVAIMIAEKISDQIKTEYY